MSKIIFKEKDKVKSAHYNETGEVVGIYKDSAFPIEVKFQKRGIVKYTADGRKSLLDTKADITLVKNSTVPKKVKQKSSQKDTSKNISSKNNNDILALKDIAEKVGITAKEFASVTKDTPQALNYLKQHNPIKYKINTLGITAKVLGLTYNDLVKCSNEKIRKKAQERIK